MVGVIYTIGVPAAAVPKKYILGDHFFPSTFSIYTFWVGKVRSETCESKKNFSWLGRLFSHWILANNSLFMRESKFTYFTWKKVDFIPQMVCVLKLVYIDDFKLADFKYVFSCFSIWSLSYKNASMFSLYIVRGKSWSNKENRVTSLS